MRERADDHDGDASGRQTPTDPAVARTAGQDGHDVQAGNASGRDQCGEHGRDDRADEHPDHAGPGNLERADREASMACLPPGQPGQCQQDACDHGDSRRQDAQHDCLAEDVPAELAGLCAVGRGQCQ